MEVRIVPREAGPIRRLAESSTEGRGDGAVDGAMVRARAAIDAAAVR